MIRITKCRLFSNFYQRDILEMFHTILKKKIKKSSISKIGYFQVCQKWLQWNYLESILKLEVSIFLIDILGNLSDQFFCGGTAIYINGEI